MTPMAHNPARPQHESWQHCIAELPRNLPEQLQAVIDELIEQGLVEPSPAPRCVVQVDPVYQSTNGEWLAPIVSRWQLAVETIDWPIGQLPAFSPTGHLLKNGRQFFFLMQLRHRPGLLILPSPGDDTGKVIHIAPERGPRLTLRCRQRKNGLSFVLQIDKQPFDISQFPSAEKSTLYETLSQIDLSTWDRMQINRKLRWATPDYHEIDLHLTLRDIQGLRQLADWAVKENIVEDSRHLANFKVWRIGDFFAQAIRLWLANLRQFSRRSLQAKQPVSLRELLQLWQQANAPRLMRYLEQSIFQNPLCQFDPRDGQDPLLNAATLQRVAMSGPGWFRHLPISDPQQFHSSDIGRLCPLDTPQSDKTGVLLSLTTGAVIDEHGFICARLLDMNTDQISQVLPFSQERVWVAFPDQLTELRTGQPVWAFAIDSGYRTQHNSLQQVAAECVRYQMPAQSHLYGLLANLLPYRNHNDPVRSTMTCSFLRQTLPLLKAEPQFLHNPASQQTVSATLETSGYAPSLSDLSFGIHLLAAYLPWKGWNFEDALVISEDAAEKLTSVHQWRADIELQQLPCLLTQLDLLELQDQGQLQDIDLTCYENGVIKPGQTVTPGQPLAIEPPRATVGTGGRERIPFRHTAALTKAARVVETRLDQTQLSIFLESLAPAQLGDKLANRHGQKGVIGLILPKSRMPYFLTEFNADAAPCLCGEQRPHKHFEILINPFGVLPRKNLGQLMETALRDAPDCTQWPAEAICYDPEHPVQPLTSPVFFGYQYILKLDHNADEKWNARASVEHDYGRYLLQPVKGRKWSGGQRFGEMETWALLAHDTPHLLQEMLTLKSDNPALRAGVQAYLLGKRKKLPHPDLPEAFHVFNSLLKALGLQIDIESSKTKPLTNTADLASISPLNLRALCIRPGQAISGTDDESHLRANLSPDDILFLRLRLLNMQQFIKRESCGEVSSALLHEPDSGRNRFTRDGLLSEQIFGPVNSFSCQCGQPDPHEIGRTAFCQQCGTPLVHRHARRKRMGHIRLGTPILHPLDPLVTTAHLTGILPISKLAVSQLFNKYPVICFAALIDYLLLAPLPSCALLYAALQEFDVDSHSDLTKLAANVAIIAKLPQKTRECWSSPAILAAERVTPEENTEAGFAQWETTAQILTNAGFELFDDKLSTSSAMTRYQTIFDLLCNASGIKIIDIELDHILANSAYSSHTLTILDSLIVLPPELRLSYNQESGRRIEHDLTLFYQRIIKARVNPPQPELASPKDWARFYPARRNLQLQVARLMLNERLYGDYALQNALAPCFPKPLIKSVSNLILEKKGLLYGHLFGKRVDFSARAVITPNPELSMDECRLSPLLAMRLFRPLLIRALHDESIEQAEALVENALSGCSDALQLLREPLRKALATRPVLLNRQPTLHRLGLLAFNADLLDESTQGQVIQIPALPTEGFNADFDGDQMAVYLPISEYAVQEAYKLLPSRHVWHPADGRFALHWGQELAYGGFLADGAGQSKQQVIEHIQCHAEDLDIANRIENLKSQAFITATQNPPTFGLDALANLADDLNHHPTGLTDYVENLAPDHPWRAWLMSGALKKIEVINELAGRLDTTANSRNFFLGLSDAEYMERAFQGRSSLVNIKFGTAQSGTLTKRLVDASHATQLSNMADCGDTLGIKVRAAECSIEFLTQEKAIPDLMAAYAERGWTFLRQFPVPCRKDQKPDGYHLIFEKTLAVDNHDYLFFRLHGRTLAQAWGELPAGTWLDHNQTRTISDWLLQDCQRQVMIRSPLSCLASRGVCAHCYGIPPWRGLIRPTNAKPVLAEPNLAIGIIAAQAVGEPGTQLALSSKHGTLHSSQNIGKLLTGLSYATEPDMQAHELVENVFGIYWHQAIEIASVHFETLLKAQLTPDSGWLQALFKEYADTSSLLSHILTATGHKPLDELQGLKQKILIGALFNDRDQ